MISITQFNQLCLDIRSAVPGITKHFLVAHEGHAIKKLKDKSGIFLVGVIPSADREGQPNQAVDRNSSWLFVVEKDIDGQSDEKELQQYQRTQELILSIRDYIEERSSDGIPLLNRYEASATKIDPEYREFGGFNGWSMSLVF